MIVEFCNNAFNLEYLELNHLERFTDIGLPKVLKILNNLKCIQCNALPPQGKDAQINITEEKLEEIRAAYPHVNIVRHGKEDYTTEKDNGLRMPYRNRGTVKKTKKKKKK